MGTFLMAKPTHLSVDKLGLQSRGFERLSVTGPCVHDTRHRLLGHRPHCSNDVLLAEVLLLLFLLVVVCTRWQAGLGFSDKVLFVWNKIKVLVYLALQSKSLAVLNEIFIITLFFIP